MRTDVVRTYKDIHSWVGIISGLALFIAFYAGAITMFEEPLQRWASPPPAIAAPPSLERTPELVEKLLAAYPDAARSYKVFLETGPEQPARVSWSTGTRGKPGITYYATLAENGALEVSTREPLAVAQLVDVLHQQVGLPFEHEISMPIMGAIALLYAVALVSGVVCLLPSLVKDLFALRLGKNVKRMWLDLHNVLGLFSLPFHIVMAVTAVIFAFHDEIYLAQGTVQRVGAPTVERRGPPPSGKPSVLTASDMNAVRSALPPVELAQRIESQLPGFNLRAVSYEYNREEGPHGHIMGTDPRYGMRGPTYGMGEVDTRTGKLIEADYLLGKQDAWFATVTSFFALHFGNFGGPTVQCSYFLLGMTGAFIFYSGNLLWIESRRKKERKAGAVEQTRATRILGALTVGVPLGCIAGISITIAAAKFLSGLEDLATWHSRIYYAVFLLAVGWAFGRGAARAGSELLWFACAATATIPLASALGGYFGGWNHGDATLLVDLTAAVGALAFAVMAVAARRRAVAGSRDSVWSIRRVAATRA
ncbi:PepSY-associated TM helix domain-containing protein [Novosphingobium sp. BL-52-GroH]|uniref:PepSY-associated TM helix domain-containing protein n=1 Tax=Novosphingobium sp. BL-52-GroH TaxID=3349877 RepID=UPI0038503BC3